nr:agrin-like isoform X4 [Paramormyrops kingsleyae]
MGTNRNRTVNLYGWAMIIVIVFNRHYCHGSCLEKELEKREEEANIVLTGTVEEIMNMDPVHKTYSCKVRVWRYLKGKSKVNGEVLLDGGNKVMIGGFGDPEICDNQVATGDTRIFFVNLAPGPMLPAHKNELMLNSSLMRITLRNLEDVEHCVEDHRMIIADKPVNFQNQILDGCRGMLCGFGAACERLPADPSRAQCVCKKMACPQVVAPVCGSDSSTYSNECELEKAQCSMQRRIKVVRKGPCAVRDPCSDVTCSYGSTCVQSSDGQSARCMCPLNCEGHPRRVVCGSDGQDYPSECELHKQACDLQRNIRKQQDGHCDPCRNKTTCWVELGTRRMVVQSSSQACPVGGEPVCASDGQTYNNTCQMKHASIQQGVTLTELHRGPCKKQGECSETCLFNSVCLVEQRGSRCSCEPILCDAAYRPLCGQDGNTYGNDCERQRAECLARAHIPVKHQGPCDLHIPSPCQGYRCEWEAMCVVKDGGPVCECPDMCPPSQDPVCGSDGHTYGNQCQMKTLSCTLQKNIHMKHRGPCKESCGNCSFGAICDGQTGQCVCPTECIDTHQPVCGTDGTTYSSECQLNVQACTEQKDLKVAVQGECKTCGGSMCTWGARCVRNKCECPSCRGEPFSPVCGSNGVTYDNNCELRLDSCVHKIKIDVVKTGRCDEECGSGDSGSGSDSGCDQERCRMFGGSWDEDAEDDRCVCDFTCHSVPRSPVCGSDGRNYSSECEFKKTKCEKQMHLQILNQGPCMAPLNSLPSPETSQNCSQTTYGCCLDKRTAALGVALAGCPSTCHCNPYGSYGSTCDPVSGQCSCKPGVGGLKCDRCKPGFWNFRGIATEKSSGCTPCNCDPMGSVRDDCEQMSGLCSCKTGVKGLKCNLCPNGTHMGANGCDKGPEAPVSCAKLTCKFGAICVEEKSQVHCECPSPDCLEGNQTKVCGSDGITYADQCQLKTIACRQNKHITVVHRGQCQEVSRITNSTGASTNSNVAATLFEGTVPPPSLPDMEDADEQNNQAVEALPPQLAEATPGTLPLPTHPTTTQHQPRRATPPGSGHVSTPTLYEDSGSGQASGDDEEGSAAMEASGEVPAAESTAVPTLLPAAEAHSSCDSAPFGCCSDGLTAASSPEGPNCPPTMKFSAYINLEQVDGQEVFFTPEMEDPKSELFGETARSIENALNELFHKSDVKTDFKSVQVQNIAPSGSIMALVEAHFDSDTSYTMTDVAEALVKQIKASKETGIVVKKPVESHTRFYSHGLSTLTVITTTVATPIMSMAAAAATHHPALTSRGITTAAPMTTAPFPTSTTMTPAFRPNPANLSGEPVRPCDLHSCLYGGTCEDNGSDFKCICPAGRGGKICEKAIKYFIPSFGGKSFLAFPTMKAYHTVRIAMEFRASEMTGLLLFNGQRGKKDFLSLALVSGRVQLRFNTGSGTGTVLSQVRVTPGRWHQLVVIRTRRQAVLSVDGEQSVEGSSPAGTEGLNLDTDLFIGGVSEKLLQDVKEKTSVSSGLVGCVRTLDINNMVYDLQDDGQQVLHSSAVTQCGETPCLPNPCRNSATCQVREADTFHCRCPGGFSGPTCAETLNPCDPNKCHPSSQCQVLPEGKYKCQCPVGREGTHCERELISNKSVHYIPFFSGNSYLELKGLHTFGSDLQNKVSMTVVFLANDSNGMIFYNGQKTDGKGDFISLSLNDGTLEFRYDLGKGPAVIRSKNKVQMNVWNTVNLERANRKGEISINGKDTVRGESPDQHTILNLKDSLFVGGAPDFRKLARAAALRDGFNGAVQSITLMGTPILTQANIVRSRDISAYPYHPCSRGICQNGGLCRPQGAGHECVCQHGFSGVQCQNAIHEKSAGEAESIAFDGRTYIEYHNAVTKSQLTNEIPDPKSLESPSDQSEKALLVNKFEMSIRTEASHGLILWSGKGVERSDYIALAVVDGRVQMTYDLGSKPVVLQSSVRVNTNRWVRIKASRALKDGSLQVGNEAPVTGSSPLGATQLDTDGALWLGGLEELPVARRLPKAYSTGFVGCIKDVSVDGVELHLVEDALNSPRILHCSAQ